MPTKVFVSWSGNPSLLRQMTDTILDMTYKAVTTISPAQQTAP